MSVTRERGRAGRVARGLRDVALGTERRLGLWILPLFLMTGLLGATLAGTLAILYYGQQVSQLESTTAAARAQLDEAVEDVTATAEEARADIEEAVRQFRESLATGSPIESPSDVGVFAASADHGGGEIRAASAFTIFSDRSQTALVTTYRLVATADGGAVRAIDVYTPQGTFSARVHNFDRDLDVAVAVLEGGPVAVLEWRPAGEPVTRGDTVFLAGVAGPRTAAVLEGKVGGISDEALVPTVPVNAFVSGGPLLDSSGRAVAIASLDYAPFGQVGGDLAYAIPVRRLCERLIRCTAEDLGAGGLGDEGGAGTAPPPRDAEADDPEPGGEGPDPAGAGGDGGAGAGTEPAPPPDGGS